MVLVVLFIIIILSIISSKRIRSHRSGEYLENCVNRELNRYEKDGGKVIQNCMLKWSNGTTTQIDNILITKKGIFVIECKDYRGWIFGTDNQNNWTEVYRMGRNSSQKSSFYNPIKQNNSHIKCLRYKIKNYKVPIFSIIVFSNECEFKNITNNTDVDIIREYRLSQTINRILSVSEEVLLPSQIQLYYDVLTTDVEITEETKSQHLYNVNRIKEQKEYERNYEGTNCPKCGSPLVLRKGQYGDFYGCSRYPYCKYTKHIK